MSLTSYFWGSTQFDEQITKATSETLPSGAEDIAANLEICDQIRSKAVNPKDAMKSLKTRLNHKNPNVQIMTLNLTDTCVKNGGDAFLTEISSREFMDNLVSILKQPALNHDVKNRILLHVQNWALSFEGKPHLSYVGTVYKTLQKEGFNFPPKDITAVSSAMTDTQTAPDWIDSDVCLRCRDPFSFTNRKHHCRNCGQVFDQKCSSKMLPLPHYGITQEVRVCEGCYAKLHKHKADKPCRRSNTLKRRSGHDNADADLQRAIQLSIEESRRNSGYTSTPYVASEPPIIDRSTRPARTAEDEDADLRAAIEASLREAEAPKPSAPLATPSEERDYGSYGSLPSPSARVLPSYDLELHETDQILYFSQAMQGVVDQGGFSARNGEVVQELYNKTLPLRPKLAMSLDDTVRREQLLTNMNENISEIVRIFDTRQREQLAHRRNMSMGSNSGATSYGDPRYPAMRYHTVDGSQSQYYQDPGYNPAYANPAQQQQQWAQAPPQQTYSDPSAAYNYPAQASQAPSDPQSQWTQPVSQQPQWNQAPPGPQPVPPLETKPVTFGQRAASPSQQYQYQPMTNGPVSLPPSSYAQPAPPAVQSPPPLVSQPQLYQQQPVQQPSQPPAQSFQYQAASPPLDNVVQSLPPVVQQQTVQPVQSPPTVSSPYQVPPQHQQTLPPSALPTNPNVSLPVFPVAPTSQPQAYPSYGPSVSGVEQNERKEVMLIEL
ncbi:ubiquitin binding protein [Sistotremastrum suecicum HHB10207 ss-3]|uniref:Vacuolar protein sorting-associated protein 27 n=1 Tax=Sistotremastrum suecicum HHB10207 ss-3 TaxID=1314776 RepID=A0A166HKH8_9AGAM|nr:ubiquitin binding protein [Sistotremastrum suecicum HHB10207 ss-3]